MFGIRDWYMQYTNVELLTILPLKTLSSKNVAIKMLKTLISNQASINNVGNEKYDIEGNYYWNYCYSKW